MCPTDKTRLLRELSGAPRDSLDGTPRLYFAPSNPVRHFGSTGVGQGGVAPLALARTTLAVWDLISGRIVRSFDLSWRPADTY